ncbi:hypothetical protein Bca52824_025164 [Brassica carinata]|uniref:RING-type E3 ubiquitin transferase n=1 Tax=Brassica carinata TaxID=52824 RepID=A0A8X7VLX3_BRACI|nr:hypothetical protein Bca52824_025164 [Brassica carinata]
MFSFCRSPLVRRQGKQYGDLYDSDSDLSSFISPSSHRDSHDISFISSGRPSVDRSSITLDFPESGRSSRISTSSEQSIGSHRLGIKFSDPAFPNESSSTFSEESDRTPSYSSQGVDDVEAEMKRLRLELKQTMDMYSNACKEALSARQHASELQKLRTEEEKRLEEAKSSEEAAMSIVETERAKAKAALEAAEAAKRLAEVESKRRVTLEMTALKESDSFSHDFVRFYALMQLKEDHSFRKSVELHKASNMVLLLGACPEFGILVYEYMAKGSLEDRLFMHGNTRPITWQLRFRIAAEIATGLLFLHQTKPEPIVHRDLKPANVLLDHNYVSKISDVGLARLVPAVAENVTQYRVTSAAGTFCYIDPEYQQTGMLGVKSDVYSLGIMLLQILTGKQPMGLTYYVEQAIEEGRLKDMLDPAVPDWPMEEAMCLAKLALQCAELRRKDRPDLGKELLPELNRLRAIGDESLGNVFYAGSQGKSPNTSQVSISSSSDPFVTSSESPPPEESQS